jgi:hypothetical protein
MLTDFVGENDFHRGRLIKVVSFVKVGVRRRERFQRANTSIRTESILRPFPQKTGKDFVHLFLARSRL